MCKVERGEEVELSLATASPGGQGGPFGWEKPEGWKEWIDEELDPGFAPLESGKLGGPWQLW